MEGSSISGCHPIHRNENGERRSIPYQGELGQGEADCQERLRLDTVFPGILTVPWVASRALIEGIVRLGGPCGALNLARGPRSPHPEAAVFPPGFLAESIRDGRVREHNLLDPESLIGAWARS